MIVLYSIYRSVTWSSGPPIMEYNVYLSSPSTYLCVFYVLINCYFHADSVQNYIYPIPLSIFFILIMSHNFDYILIIWYFQFQTVDNVKFHSQTSDYHIHQFVIKISERLLVELPFVVSSSFVSFGGRFFRQIRICVKSSGACRSKGYFPENSNTRLAPTMFPSQPLGSQSLFTLTGMMIFPSLPAYSASVTTNNSSLYYHKVQSFVYYCIIWLLFQITSFYNFVYFRREINMLNILWRLIIIMLIQCLKYLVGSSC